MKSIAGLFLFLLLTGTLVAQTLHPNDGASTVSFRIKNLGVATGGTIKGLAGKTVFNPADLSGSVFDVSVAVSTLNTGIDMRDDHLKKEDYFDLAHYATIQLVSDRVVGSNKKNTWFFYGKLTIKGITKAISFPFTAVQEGAGYRFTAEFKINRRDFKVGGSSLTLSDEVTVRLSVLAE